MDDAKLKLCELFIDNKNKIKSVFKGENALIHVSTSMIYTLKNQSVDVERLLNCKKLLKEKTSSFSTFRGVLFATICAFMALSDDYNDKLDMYLNNYKLLKKEFSANDYLPLLCAVLTDCVDNDNFNEMLLKTKQLYKAIKANHRFLTSSEDQTLCAMLALTNKSVDEIVNEVEENYSTLKVKFHSLNDVQALSHTLACFDGSSQVKCEKTISLFDLFKENKKKYSTGSELPSLAILAMSNKNSNELVDETIDIDNFLSRQKGFKGLFALYNKHQRLMYAAMLANYPINGEVMSNVTTNITLSSVIAQHSAIMCCCMASIACCSVSSSAAK